MATSCMQEGNGFRSSFSDCHNSGAPVFFGSRAFPAHAAPSCAMKNSALLLISCPDRRGEVATLAHFVYRRGGSILHADAGADEESALFLMRVEFDPKDFDIDLSQPDLSGFGKQFSPVAEACAMKWRLAQSAQRPRMIIFVSKYDHCLLDLLDRRQSGEIALPGSADHLQSCRCAADCTVLQGPPRSRERCGRTWRIPSSCMGTRPFCFDATW
jgi:hypothetical protein